MKLYMHPVSNTSRPVLLFIAENKLPVESEIVDLMTGAHYQEPYISLNPNRPGADAGRRRFRAWAKARRS